jgi:hypothetical protein
MTTAGIAPARRPYLATGMHDLELSFAIVYSFV